jgi:hypothetical protein
VVNVLKMISILFILILVLLFSVHANVANAILRTYSFDKDFGKMKF